MLVASHSTFGGGERNLLDIAECLYSHKNYVPYVVLPGKGRLKAELEKLDIKTIVIPMNNLLNVAALFSIRSLLKDANIMLIHAHGARAALFSRVANLLGNRVPLVYTIHGVHYPHYTSPIKKSIYLYYEKTLKNYTDAFLCVCKSDYSRGVKAGIIDASKAFIVYNGVNLSKYTNAYDPHKNFKNIIRADDRKILLSIGRLHRQKGFQVLLEAAKQVINKYPKSLFVIVGEGEEKQFLLKRKEDLRISDENFMFVGETADVSTYLVDADIFVMPSLWEGFPYAILEAMLFKKPIISTNVDGIPEAVVDKETGLLVPPNNPDALADAILYMMNRPDLAIQYGIAGFKRVTEHFTSDRMLSTVLSIYENIL